MFRIEADVSSANRWAGMRPSQCGVGRDGRRSQAVNRLAAAHPCMATTTQQIAQNTGYS